MRASAERMNLASATAAGGFGTDVPPPAPTTRRTPAFRARHVDGLIGNAPSLELVLEKIARVGPTSAAVLITGETGTGKELVARALHRQSRRAAQTMVCANLAAVPSELVASELFGHEPGSFTGAIQRRIGRFEAAHGSTLFLDEVGELPPGIQVALLRTIQEGEFERVGSSQTRRVDVRLIAATNRDLAEAIECGLFRRDLFYRLAVFPIHLPPLRDRLEDIPALARHFLACASERLNRSFAGIDRESLQQMKAYGWPGNIRELQNVVEHSAILSDGDYVHVPEVLLSSEVIADRNSASTLPATLEHGERRLIEQALQESNGRVFGPRGAARRLGIPSSTLESKIKRLNVNKLQYRNPRS